MANVLDYAARAPSRWRCYLELTKPKVVALISFTALVGALLAGPGFTPLEPLLCGILGIALAAGCAATLNQRPLRHAPVFCRERLIAFETGRLCPGNCSG
jgi:heme O synthase-like polyprenyltransferase